LLTVFGSFDGDIIVDVCWLCDVNLFSLMTLKTVTQRSVRTRRYPRHSETYSSRLLAPSISTVACRSTQCGGCTIGWWSLRSVRGLLVFACNR